MKTSSPSSGNTKYRTLAQWNREGFRVVRGSKAVKFHKSGDALFSQKQVARSVLRRRDTHQSVGDYDYNQEGWGYEGSWEEMISEYDMPGAFG